jgi:hypothetical protein
MLTRRASEGLVLPAGRAKSGGAIARFRRAASLAERGTT